MLLLILEISQMISKQNVIKSSDSFTLDVGPGGLWSVYWEFVIVSSTVESTQVFKQLCDTVSTRFSGACPRHTDSLRTDAYILYFFLTNSQNIISRYRLHIYVLIYVNTATNCDLLSLVIISNRPKNHQPLHSLHNP